MANEGVVTILPARSYENYESLKKWIGSRTDSRSNNYNEIITHHTKLTTGATGIEIEALGDVAVAIGQIGRAEVTVLLGASGDNASTNGNTYSMTYVNASGVSTTVAGTGTATLNGTNVAFVPAVTDFLYCTAFTGDADANVNVTVTTTGNAHAYATITAVATAATEAQLLGVGAVYARTSTNHGDSDGGHLYMEYLSGAGLIKHGHCTLETGDSTTETRFFEAVDDGDGTTTATTTSLKDFYRLRWCHTNITPTTNTGEYLITDAACANVDGSGGDIYGIMVEGDFEMGFTRYCCPTGYTAWLAFWHTHAAAKVVGATTDTFNLDVYYTDRIWAHERKMHHVFSGHEEEEMPIPLAEMSDLSFFVSDNGGPQTIHFDSIIVEVQN